MYLSRASALNLFSICPEELAQRTQGQHILAGHEERDSGKDRQVSCGAARRLGIDRWIQWAGRLAASGFKIKSRNRVDRRKASAELIVLPSPRRSSTAAPREY